MMMNKKWFFGALFIGLLAGSGCFAEVKLAPLFNDGAVLQCEMPVNIWGTADPGETVTVSFAGQTKSAVADSSNHWKIVLDPMTASSEPRKLTVSSSSENQPSSIGNVTVGEVWLATGQSNMVIPLRGSDGGDEVLTQSFPKIRFMKVPQRTGLPVTAEFTAAHLAWKTVAPPVNQEIAAVAFYFAEKLQAATGRQVGIIQSSYGGTPCEAWTPMSTLESTPGLQPLADLIHAGLSAGKTEAQWTAEVQAFQQWKQDFMKWQRTKKGPRPALVPRPGQDNPWYSQSPTVLYENMIRPLVPYTARGVVWYQGESNADNPDEYRILFPAMIHAWRKVWDRPDWPFFFVQLAAYQSSPDQNWPELRAAQASVRDTVENTGMALAIDCGERKQIHPRAKRPVGERLARLALDNVYGLDEVSRGPCFKSFQQKDGKIRVEFEHVEDGLKSADGTEQIPGFEVAGSDGQFHAAEARIVSVNCVEVACREVDQPVAVRYAWAGWIEPPVTLENSAGLPAEPFVSK